MKGGRFHKFTMPNLPQILILTLLTVVGTSTTPAFSDPMPAGVFIHEVLLYNDPQGQIHNEGPPESMIGRPDGRFVDLDGGGTTVAFGDTPVEFDWWADLPDGTRLVLVDMGPGRNDGPPGTELVLSFGYGIPADNGDGVAANAQGKARFLGWDLWHTSPRRDRPVARLLFYAFDDTFQGLSPDFYLSVDDFRDQEVDAIFIFDSM